MSERAKRGLALLVVALAWVTLTPEHAKQGIPSSKPAEISLPKKVQTKATWKEKNENRKLAREYSKALGYTKKERDCLITLWTRESRFDHLADNPRSSAFGIAQRLREKSRRPDIQILHGLRYIDHRFGGSACRALAWHRERGWY